MNRRLTLPLIKMIFKTICIVCILFASLLGLGTADAFIPSFPTQLTLLTKDGQYTPSPCPTLSKVLEQTSQKQVTPPFTLLNWNIYKQKKENWGTSLIEWSNNADFITLQEAKLSPALIQFSQQNKLFYLHNYAFKYKHEIYGVNTLSKVTPLSFCGNTYKEPWIRVPKAGIATTYTIKGNEAPLLIINLHGVNFTFTKRPLHEQLAPYLTLIKQHSGPVIFSGDFNTWNSSRLTDVEQSLIASGFSEALFTNDKRLTVFGLPLDHIYFRGLKVIEAKSLSTDASDHSPQLVTFDLEEAEN